MWLLIKEDFTLRARIQDIYKRDQGNAFQFVHAACNRVHAEPQNLLTEN